MSTAASDPASPRSDGVDQRSSGRGSATSTVLRLLSAYGLLALLVGLFALFAILLPNTFLTEFNIRGILSDKSIVAMLALAAMVPIATNSFDLSIGYGIGLYHILAMGFIVNQGIPWPVVVVMVLLVGALVGLVNGLLVTRAGIDPFIATLGVGTILYGIAFWYAPIQIVGQLPAGFVAISSSPFGIPLPFVYLILVSIALWIMFERLPTGRFLYMLGANMRAAELVGISSRRYIPFAFIVSGLITAFAGIVLAAKLQVAQVTIGPDYLLPAFVGALLGSTSIRPGRPNVVGTLVAVFVLAITVAGLQQLGAQFFVEPLFNGSMLLAAVGLAALAVRRRARTRANADAAAR
jgi:ribose transport system permease protein